MFLAALPRVAGLPVGDLARLTAVAPRDAPAADGEGGLIFSRESAADVAHPSTYPSISGALLSMSAGICRLTARRTAFDPFDLPLAVVGLACCRPTKRPRF